MRNVVLIVFSLIVFSVLAWACTAVAPADDRPAAAAAKGRAVSLETKTVELHECPVKAVKTARLATDRPGVLAAVEPKEGDAVREGQIVARLMDEVAQASLDVAKLVADDHVEIQYATKLNAVDRPNTRRTSRRIGST